MSSKIELFFENASSLPHVCSPTAELGNEGNTTRATLVHTCAPVLITHHYLAKFRGWRVMRGQITSEATCRQEMKRRDRTSNSVNTHFVRFVPWKVKIQTNKHFACWFSSHAKKRCMCFIDAIFTVTHLQKNCFQYLITWQLTVFDST